MFSDYANYDAIGLAERVRRSEVTPTELLEAALARLEAVNPRINAVTLDHRDFARKQIEAGLPPGPLRGVPFLLKDLHASLAGTLTTNGSAFFRDNLADHDTELVSLYRRAGLVICGKTNTPEFGLTVTTEPSVCGTTHNPWNLEYSPGGSSGGSAAAVAAGIVPVAHASDGGGSIRIPSSCCGLYGLKPTRARNPAGPDRGEGWAGMSTEHVISRSVRDSAALLDLTQGPDVGAPYFAPPPLRPYLAEVNADPGRLRIGVMTATVDGVPIDPECAAAVQAAARLADKSGHHVEEVTPAFLEPAFGDAFRVVIAGNIAAAIRDHAQRLGKVASAAQFEGLTWMLAQMGEMRTALDYAAAVRCIHRVGRRVGAFFENYDILMTPTMPDPPRKLGYFRMSGENPAEDGAKVARATMFTSLFNASGHPAASLPLHWTPDGLPVGVQIVSRYGDEPTLIRLSAQYERACPWALRRPAL